MQNIDQPSYRTYKKLAINILNDMIKISKKIKSLDRHNILKPFNFNNSIGTISNDNINDLIAMIHKYHEYNMNSLEQIHAESSEWILILEELHNLNAMFLNFKKFVIFKNLLDKYWNEKNTNKFIKITGNISDEIGKNEFMEYYIDIMRDVVDEYIVRISKIDNLFSDEDKDKMLKHILMIYKEISKL